jgi:hypothetical protein
MIGTLLDEPMEKWDDRVWRETTLPVLHRTRRSVIGVSLIIGSVRQTSSLNDHREIEKGALVAPLTGH